MQEDKGRRGALALMQNLFVTFYYPHFITTLLNPLILTQSVSDLSLDIELFLNFSRDMFLLRSFPVRLPVVQLLLRIILWKL